MNKLSHKIIGTLILSIIVSFSWLSVYAQPRMLVGCSGKSIEEYGIKREVYGTWMARSSWDDLKKGNWLWAEVSGLPQWKKEHFDRATDVGVPLIPTDGGRNLDSLLKEVINGSQDSVYFQLGRMLAVHGTKTVFARLWWEFNMYPVKQDPKLFTAAWKHAVPLIRQGFSTKAVKGQTMEVVWCTNSGVPNPVPFYPGDDVVDIIGSDTYGMVWGKSNPTKAQILRRIFKDPYMLEWQSAFALKHKKPVCIGEWANVASKPAGNDDTRGARDFPEYIDAIFDWAKSNKYGCRYLNYFNLVDGGILISLDDTPKSLARLKSRCALLSSVAK
ncbi:hypothetical protein MTO98_08135 [Mucilaginibacter sp. SMC90]|uniref:glycosyl hydrolase n=1 Tax=Mucilaginibacter sp. SMC90 TaxID=2929803 RepID=UPI001FB2E376|nr:glycosyl hydrolase [Mucilaginibacter sp. SMC90]UOE51043.1 hypothetical protein MTO98_08135 [Mucilaginibacter sp. SMC90]